MGVWQVTNETQPYVGQWDPKADTIWNGTNWVEFGIGLEKVDVGAASRYNFYWPSVSYGAVADPQACTSPSIEQIKRQMEEVQKAYQLWQAPRQAQTPTQPKQETQPQAQDPWEALKSMF